MNEYFFGGGRLIENVAGLERDCCEWEVRGREGQGDKLHKCKQWLCILIKVSKIIYPLDIRAPKYTKQTVMDIQTECNVRAAGNHITPLSATVFQTEKQQRNIRFKLCSYAAFHPTIVYVIPCGMVARRVSAHLNNSKGRQSRVSFPTTKTKNQ